MTFLTTEKCIYIFLLSSTVTVCLENRPLSKPFGSDADSSFVELLIVMDSNLMNLKNRKVEDMHKEIRLLATHVNYAMQPLNVFVYLTGHSIVNVNAVMNISSRDTAAEALAKFSRFITENAGSLGIFDHAILITGDHYRSESGDIQKSHLGGICFLDSSLSLITDLASTDSFRKLVSATSYALARNLGIENDEGHDCVCLKRPCIMNSYNGRMSFVEWSSCSKDFLKRYRSVGLYYCLENLPRKPTAQIPYDAPTTASVNLTDGNDNLVTFEQKTKRNGNTELRSAEFTSRCGNGFVEPGEECDCGLSELCSQAAKACCDPMTCKLTANATCANGDCCNFSTCQLKPSGSVCRQAVGECDLPEYCSGENENCPNDFSKQSGTPCSNGQALCHKGLCLSLDLQCKRIFGDTAVAASLDFWYANLSPLTSPDFGCGLGVACANDSDIKCGRLLCEHESEKPALFYPPPRWREKFLETNGDLGLSSEGSGDSTKLLVNVSRFDAHRTQTRSGNWVVREAAYVVVNPMPGAYDPGFVQDGTPCGSFVSSDAAKGVCFDHVCVLDKPSHPCNSRETCSGHGVCNSVENCHCDVGFAPPFCNTSGNGGSLQSGPPPPRVIPFDDFSDVVAIVLSILLLLLFSVVIAMAAIFRRKLEIWYYSHVWSSSSDSRFPKFSGKNSIIRLNIARVQRKWGNTLSSSSSRHVGGKKKVILAAPVADKEQAPRRNFRGLDISTPVLKHSTRRDLDSLMPLYAVNTTAQTPDDQSNSFGTTDVHISSSDGDGSSCDAIVGQSPDLIQSTYQPPTFQETSDEQLDKRQCSIPKRQAPRAPQEQSKMALLKMSFSVPERLAKSKKDVSDVG